MKKLVAYFSASGVTERVASRISDLAEADLFEIEPEVRYTNADLDWTNNRSRSTLEMKDESSRPPFKKKLSTLGEYDVIFIGFPNWWGVEPRIIDTFLESYDFSNKTVVPFFTSGGSGKGRIKERIEKEVPSAKVLEVVRLSTSSDIKSYLDSLNL